MSCSHPRLACALLLTANFLTGCKQETDTACPAGQLRCDFGCVDTATSDSHCGACGQPCGLGTCVAGGCVCAAGATDCGAWPACVDLATNEAHCGACATPCRPGEECTDPGATGLGSCSCLPGFSDCPLACFDLQVDERNCGSCGHDCPLTNDVCKAGTCACPPATPDVCGDTCVDRLTDPTACGSGCAVCPLGADCGQGSCCTAAKPTFCGPSAGSCADLATDEAHCGACDSACTGGQVCSTGLCCGASQLVCVGAGKRCCDGTACCPGGACQTVHDNGLGGTWRDCSPARTYTLDAAGAAADAWATGVSYTEFQLGCLGCFGRQTANACAVWCYDGVFAGTVHENTLSDACLCPPQGDVIGAWN